MIRIEGTRVELWALPGTVGLRLPQDSWALTPEQARRLATRLLQAAREAENAAPDPSPAAAAAEVTPELAPITADRVAIDLLKATGGDVAAAADLGEAIAADAPRPMTGAEALDAADTPEEWASTALGIFDTIARAARDEADREDGES